MIIEDILEQDAVRYSHSGFQNTYYLGYRDLPWILSRFAQNGKKALDFGCGSGRSTIFLKDRGYSAIGVDLSETMLDIAKKNDPSGDYRLIDGVHLPFDDASFDLVLSCFVFLTVSSKEDLNRIFHEINRVLKPGGMLIFVTGSKYLYIKKYLSYDVLPRKNLITGDEIDITLKDLGVSFKNYFYSDQDYRSFIETSGLELVLSYMPLGQKNEQVEWLDEISFSPYIIYGAKKTGVIFSQK